MTRQALMAERLVATEVACPAASVDLRRLANLL